MLDQLNEFAVSLGMKAATLSQMLVGGDIGSPINVAVALAVIMLVTIGYFVVTVLAPFALFAGGILLKRKAAAARTYVQTA